MTLSSFIWDQQKDVDIHKYGQMKDELFELLDSNKELLKKKILIKKLKEKIYTTLM